MEEVGHIRAFILIKSPVRVLVPIMKFTPHFHACRDHFSVCSVALTWKSSLRWSMLLADLDLYGTVAYFASMKYLTYLFNGCLQCHYRFIDIYNTKKGGQES